MHHAAQPWLCHYHLFVASPQTTRSVTSRHTTVLCSHSPLDLYSALSFLDTSRQRYFCVSRMHEKVRWRPEPCGKPCCQEQRRYVTILCIYLNKGRPTWWHLLYYVNLLLNMFRMLIHPSSGACDYLVRYCVGCIVLTAVVVQPALGYHITNSQSRYITPTRLKSAQ